MQNRRLTHPLHRLSLWCLAGLAWGTAHAAPTDLPVQTTDDDPAPPLWTVGLFTVAGDHPVYPGADHRIQSAAVVPFVTYRGPLLRIEGGAAGVRAVRTPRYELSLSGTASFGSAGADVRARQGMPAVGTLAELGPGLRVRLGDLEDDTPRTRWILELPLRGVFDVDRDLRYVGLSFEPQLNASLRLPDGWQAWSVSLRAGALIANRQLNQLFYGVAPAYATPSRPAYAAQPGWIASRLGGSLSRQLAPGLRASFLLGLESVAGAANEGSPLVKRRWDHSVGVSLVWTAYRSDERGVE
jgi:hypothetical protein